MSAPAPPAGGPSGAAGLSAARVLTAVVPPVTLVTALLFYFGWTRTYTQARFLGADASVFGYSTQDYLLRSVDSLYFPLIVLTGLGLLALLGHRLVVDRLASSPDRADGALRKAGTALVVTGAVLLAYGVLYSAVLFRLGTRVLDLTGPLAVGLGVLLAGYGAWVRRRSTGHQTGVLASNQAPWLAPVAAGLLLALSALSLFWAVGNYARWRGQDLAEAVVATYQLRPGVVVYAPQRLALSGGGVVEDELPGSDLAYRFRYSGMRLLDRVGSTYFLLPEDWGDSPRLILLPADADLRVELTAG